MQQCAQRFANNVAMKQCSNGLQQKNYFYTPEPFISSPPHHTLPGTGNACTPRPKASAQNPLPLCALQRQDRPRYDGDRSLLRQHSCVRSLLRTHDRRAFYCSHAGIDRAHPQLGRIRVRLHLLDGAAELAGIVHYVHSPWARRVFPALELVAEQPFRSRNGDLEWAVMPQVRIGLTKGGHVALSLGVELPLSDQAWDERYYVTLLWDFADGGFFKGW